MINMMTIQLDTVNKQYNNFNPFLTLYDKYDDSIDQPSKNSGKNLLYKLNKMFYDVKKNIIKYVLHGRYHKNQRLTYKKISDI